MDHSAWMLLMGNRWFRWNALMILTDMYGSGSLQINGNMWHANLVYLWSLGFCGGMGSWMQQMRLLEWWHLMMRVWVEAMTPLFRHVSFFRWVQWMDAGDEKTVKPWISVCTQAGSGREKGLLWKLWTLLSKSLNMIALMLVLRRRNFDLTVSRLWCRLTNAMIFARQHIKQRKLKRCQKFLLHGMLKHLCCDPNLGTMRWKWMRAGKFLLLHWDSVKPEIIPRIRMAAKFTSSWLRAIFLQEALCMSTTLLSHLAKLVVNLNSLGRRCGYVTLVLNNLNRQHGSHLVNCCRTLTFLWSLKSPILLMTLTSGCMWSNLCHLLKLLVHVDGQMMNWRPYPSVALVISRWFLPQSWNMVLDLEWWGPRQSCCQRYPFRYRCTMRDRLPFWALCLERYFFAYDISGGLPRRGVKELAYAQKRAIEESLASGCGIGGYSLDLIKAYNTFGRYVDARILHRLGIPKALVIPCWCLGF